MSAARPAGRPNRLTDSASPYLRQHAANPVDWHEWSPAALALAAAENKPILLSIGYSACHWCHVMAHESFEDAETAELMNASFVNVKVDREERPDLDEIYMAATIAMNQGRGGWPMTVFLTPEQKPFFAGTYFPPEDRHGLPGFKTLLRQIAKIWRDEPARAAEVGNRVAEYLRESAQPIPGAFPGEAEQRLAVEHFWSAFDARHGGFGSAPKFPPATTIRLLLRASGDERARRMAVETLEAMWRGGMYDHVAGGFCRYSTDERWLVPHFEKMLYDNALLARAYLEASVATESEAFARVGAEILDYVLREMTSPEGAFYSATDADSEGEEGKFFVWTPAELRDVLGATEAELFGAYYDVHDWGNWEGKSIPNVPRPLATVAKLQGIDPAEMERRLAAARRKVYEARRKRVPPGLDDKTLLGWNGLMITALAEGWWVLGEKRYREAAERAARFLLTSQRGSDGKWLRVWSRGAARGDAVLEDYAYFANGLIDLYEAGAPEDLLRAGVEVVEEMRRRFAAPGGGFFATARDHEALIVRHREGHDGALPAPNALAASALARLAAHLGRADLRDEATRALAAYGEAIAKSPTAFSASLLVADFLAQGPLEVVLVGAAGEPGYEALRAEVARRFLPSRIVAHHDPALGGTALPLPAGKARVDGKAALYVCRNFTCRAPITEVRDVGGALEGRPGPRA